MEDKGKVIEFPRKKGVITELNEYQQEALRTAGNMSSEGMVLNGVMGLCGEAGECVDYYKKVIFQGHDFDPNKLIDELGDVLWYIAITAAGLGTTLSGIATHNSEKLRQRYPDGFKVNNSVYRDE